MPSDLDRGLVSFALDSFRVVKRPLRVRGILHHGFRSATFSVGCGSSWGSSMFIVTNRRVDPKASGMDRLGKRPNEKGNNELRV